VCLLFFEIQTNTMYVPMDPTLALFTPLFLWVFVPGPGSKPRT